MDDTNKLNDEEDDDKKDSLLRSLSASRKAPLLIKIPST